LRKQILLSIWLAITLILGFSAQAIADTYSHYITFTVTDNTSTDRTGLPILTGIPASSLISSGYLNSAGNQTATREGTSTTEQGVATGNISVFIDSLSALQARTYKFYTGYSPADSHKIIPGWDGYITSNDTATAEFGSNFTQQFNDVTLYGSGNISYKTNAWNLSKSTTNVTFEINNGLASPVVAGNTTTSITPASANWSITLPGSISNGDMLVAVWLPAELR